MRGRFRDGRALIVGESGQDRWNFAGFEEVGFRGL